MSARNRARADKLSRVTARGYVVTFDGDEARYDTPEEVGKVVTQYQMDHPEDPELAGITVVAEESRAPIPARHFLPQQLP